MTERAADLEQPVCSRCGNPHLPPRWDREYLCPACGAPLLQSAARRGARFLWQPWLALGLGAAIICGGVARIILDRRAVPPAATARAESPAEAVRTTAPPNLENRVKQKVRLLQEDLALAPRNPGLLLRLAECQLMLAMLYRDREDRARTGNHLNQSRRYLQRLRAVDYPATRDLSRRIEGFQYLTWGPPRLSAPSEPRLERRRGVGPAGWPGGISAGAVPRPGGPGFPFRPGPRSMPPTATRLPEPGTFPPGIPVPDIPQTGAPEGEMGGGLGGDSPIPMNAPLPMNGPRPAPMDAFGGPARRPAALPGGMPGGPGPSSRERANLLAQIAYQNNLVRKNPEDVNAVIQHGELYERLAAIAGLPRPFDRTRISHEERQWLEKALQVYLRAAERTRLRSHRAMFLDYAADVYGKLRDWEKQYDTLQRAVKAMPASPTLWRKIQSVCLLTGRRDENLKARQAFREWSFPTPELRPDELAAFAPRPWR